MYVCMYMYVCVCMYVCMYSDFKYGSIVLPKKGIVRLPSLGGGGGGNYAFNSNRARLGNR